MELTGLLSVLVPDGVIHGVEALCVPGRQAVFHVIRGLNQLPTVQSPEFVARLLENDVVDLLLLVFPHHVVYSLLPLDGMLPCRERKGEGAVQKTAPVEVKMSEEREKQNWRK